MPDVQTNLNAKLVINQLEVDPRVKKALESWSNPPSGKYVAPIKGTGGTDPTKKLVDSIISSIIGITILTKFVEASVKQSKIIGVIESSLFKGLGLLMDLVLMPFLPQIIYWIMKWYMAIVDFGKWWSTGIGNITNPIGTWKSAISNAFADIGNLVDSIFGAGTMQNFINKWGEFTKDPLKGLMDAIDSANAKNLSYFTKITEDIQREINNFSFGITSTFDQIIMGLQNAVANSALGPVLGIFPVNRASENTGMPHIPLPLEEQTTSDKPSGNIPSGSPGNIPPEVKVMINLNGTFYTEDEMYVKMQSIVDRVSWIFRVQNPSGVS